MKKTDHPKPRVGIAVIVRRDGQLLLGKRIGSHGPGTWSVPGGHLEYGETPAECAERELVEETGLTITSYDLGPWSNDIIEEGKHYITIYVFVKEFKGELQNLEPHKCEGWEWFDWDHLPEPLFPTVRSLIQKIGIETLKHL